MRSCGVFILWAFLVLGVPGQALASPLDRPCVINAQGAVGVIVNGLCVQGSFSGSTPGSQPSPSGDADPTRVVLCGMPVSADGGALTFRCGSTTTCPTGLPAATLVNVSGTWIIQSVWCPGQNTPVKAPSQPILTLQEIRDQAIRLLPTIRIGSAWQDRGLVNAEEILWAETNEDRGLPTAQVVGHPVSLRIHFDHAIWTFGDGSSATSSTPGKPYDRQLNPCTTAQCPGYFGHTYSETGRMTITLRVAWRADFSLDGGGTWASVDPDALTGPSSTFTLNVLQSRGVLVPNP